MGLCSSATFVVKPDVPGQDHIAEEVFNRLRLNTPEINKLFDIFLQIKKNDTHFIYLTELVAFLKSEENELLQKIFNVFVAKKSSSGKLDFCQFLCTVWNFLSLEAADLSSYAFILFDENNHGCLIDIEIVKLIETIHKKKYAENSGVQLLCDEIRLISRTITLKQFMKFAQAHPSLCGPLAALQFMMRKRILGDHFWIRLQQRRSKSSEQCDSRYLMKLIIYTREKYAKVEMEQKVRKIQGKRQQKIDEMMSLQTKQKVLERQRQDQMLDFFQLDPAARKKGGAGGSGKKKLKKKSSRYLQKSSKIDVWKDHESDEEEGGEEEEGDGAEEEDDDSEDPTRSDPDIAELQSSRQTTSSPPPSADVVAALSEPQVISSVALRRTLISKQHSSTDSTSSSASGSPTRKTLFQPASIPRKSIVNGVSRVAPTNDSASASQSSSPGPLSPTDSSRPRQSVISSAANPLPGISSARKTIANVPSLGPISARGTAGEGSAREGSARGIGGASPSKPPPSGRRATKLEPIRR
jgi:Ca2+-binding EF-hand superfamily protein